MRELVMEKYSGELRAWISDPKSERSSTSMSSLNTKPSTEEQARLIDQILDSLKEYLALDTYRHENQWSTQSARM